MGIRGMFSKAISLVMLVVFMTTSVSAGWAQTVVAMPVPGDMVPLSGRHDPALMAGIQLDAKDPFRFNFLFMRGEAPLSDDVKRDEYRKLVKYFLASLALPNKDMWVNLSPFEHDRIIPDNFSLTEMGRDLLAQDYLLKQITASLIHPEQTAGKAFWKKVYAAIYEKYGTTDIPLDMFNKVWIVPATATIYQKYDTALIVENHLKVMMETDYLAAQQSRRPGSDNIEGARHAVAVDDVKQVVREVVIPLLEKEVNEGENFAPLRQVYSAMLMATWFKKSLKESLLGQVYADKGKVAGVKLEDLSEDERIYQKYLQAYKVGVFNFIKEDVDPQTQEIIPRKYFSGGTVSYDLAQVSVVDLAGRLTAAQQAFVVHARGLIDRATVVLEVVREQGRSLKNVLGGYKSIAGGLMLAAGVMMMAPSSEAIAAGQLQPRSAVSGSVQGTVNFSGGQIHEYSDQLGSNADHPAWRVFVVDLPEGARDLTRFKALHLQSRGEGNFVVQVIDQKRKDMRGTDNAHYGLSDVFHAGSDGRTVIDLRSILKNQPDLDLTKGAQLVIVTGLNAGSVPINLKDDLRMEEMTLSREPSVQYGTGVPLKVHTASLAQVNQGKGEKRAELFNSLAAQVSREKFSNEFKALQTAPLAVRLGILEGLVKRLDVPFSQERDQSYHVLAAELFNPAGNTNGRRYIYNVLKKHKFAINESLLEDHIVHSSSVESLVVVNAPYYSWNAEKKEDHYAFPNWNGPVTTTRYAVKGTLYGVEGTFSRPDMVQRLLDARMLEDTVYWIRRVSQELKIEIDPLVALALGYTETQLDMFGKDGDIYQIHDQGTIRPEDTRLAQHVLQKYARSGEDMRRAFVVVNGVLYMEKQLHIFSRLSKVQGVNNGESLARLFQSYNGLGHNPLLGNLNMLEQPVIGRRVVQALKVFSNGPLPVMIQKVDEKIGYKQGLRHDWKSVNTTRFKAYVPVSSAGTPDKAATALKGGIDLDADLVEMQIRRDGAGMPLPLSMQDPAMMNIDGLLPTILEITPAHAMAIFTELQGNVRVGKES